MAKTNRGLLKRGLRNICIFALLKVCFVAQAKEYSFTFEFKGEDMELPLPVFIQEGEEFADDKSLAIKIEHVEIDGKEVELIKRVASLEVQKVWNASAYYGWKMFELYPGGHPNHFYQKAIPEINVVDELNLPEEWTSIELTYHNRDSNDKVLNRYHIHYKRAK